MFEKKHITVHGIDIEYYERSGGPETLLILHGWAHSKERWKVTAEAIKSGRRILIPDLPGFGNSGKPHVRYTLEFFVSFVKGFCAATGVDLRESFLMGHSLGGAAAAHLSARVPPKKLILVDPVLLPVWPARVVRLMGPLAPLFFYFGRKSRTLIRLCARLTVAQPVYIDQLMLSEALKPTDWSMTSALKSLGSIHLRKDVLSLACPTLLIYGTQDRAVPPSQYDFLRNGANPHVQVRPMEFLGHTPFIEHQDEFLELCERFLS